MEVYWRLASVDASEREAASVELVQGLLSHADTPLIKKLKAEKKQQTGEFENSAHKQAQEEDSAPQEKRTHKEKGTTAFNNPSQKEKEDKAAAAVQEKGARKRTLNTETEEKKETDSALSKQTEEKDGLYNCSPAVQYAVKRLVRGVASSRECARQGFAMALASLLEALPWIKIESVLQLIKTSLEVTSSMKGQEKRDGLLGQLFALGAVVQSGRLVVDDANMEAAELAKDISEQLLALAKRKVFLREPAITVLLSFIKMLPPGLLQDSVLSGPLLQETLCMDIENANADTLLLALKLHTILPSSVVESCPLLPKLKSICAIFEPSHLLSLAPILKDSTTCHPRVHPVWSFLIELPFHDLNAHGTPTPSKKKKRQKLNNVKEAKAAGQQLLASFWNLVIAKSLLTFSHERKFLAMELLQLVLHKLSPAWAELVLSKTLVRCLLDILTAKGNLLYKSAQACLESVCEWAKPDEQRIVTVIISLQRASHGKFDALSRTQSVKKLLSSLMSKEGCFLLFNKLVELFNRKKSESSQLFVVENGTDQVGVENDDREEKGSGVMSMETQRYWIIEQITSFVKQIEDQEYCCSLQKEVLKFLTVNALFVGPSGTRCYVKVLQEEVQLPEPPISESTRKLCLARLQNLLVNISPTVSPVRDTRVSGEKEEIVQEEPFSTDLRYFFLELCDTLDKIPDVSRRQPVSEDDKDVINALRLCITKLCSADMETNNELKQKMRSMCSLLMQFLLQSAMTGVTDIASELILCCKKVFGDLIEVDANGISQDEEEKPQLFMNVLVDILLSLLAQSSAPIRAAAEQVFKSFCGDLTESNMLSLLRVVKKQLKPGRRAAAIRLDTAESDEDPLLEVEDSDDDSAVIDGGSNDSDEDASNEDNAEEPEAKRLRRSKTVSQDEAANEKESKKAEDLESETSKRNSDSEDSHNSDMDDEAMFKIDMHLTNLLKQRRAASGKGEGKDARTQLLHFKFRVLSLIEYFFQKKAGSLLCLTALPHLLQVLVVSSSEGGSVQLAERISSILQGKLFKLKEYPKGKEVDREALTCLLQRCLKLASRSKIKKVRQVAQSCSFWLLKILHGSCKFENSIKEVEDALMDFFSQKKSHFRTPYFRELFMRFPGIGLSCLGSLLDSCQHARSEFLRCEALLIVSSILQLNTGKKSDTFRESLIQNLPALSEVLVGVIEKPPSSKARRSESRRFCVSLLKAAAQELPEKPVKKLIGKPAYKLCLSHFGSSVMQGINGVSSASDCEGTIKKRTLPAS